MTVTGAISLRTVTGSIWALFLAALCYQSCQRYFVGVRLPVRIPRRNAQPVFRQFK